MAFLGNGRSVFYYQNNLLLFTILDNRFLWMKNVVLAYKCKTLTTPCGPANICEFIGFDDFWCPLEP